MNPGMGIEMLTAQATFFMAALKQAKTEEDEQHLNQMVNTAVQQIIQDLKAQHAAAREPSLGAGRGSVWDSGGDDASFIYPLAENLVITIRLKDRTITAETSMPWEDMINGYTDVMSEEDKAQFKRIVGQGIRGFGVTMDGKDFKLFGSVDIDVAEELYEMDIDSTSSTSEDSDDDGGGDGSRPRWDARSSGGAYGLRSRSQLHQPNRYGW